MAIVSLGTVGEILRTESQVPTLVVNAMPGIQRARAAYAVGGPLARRMQTAPSL